MDRQDDQPSGSDQERVGPTIDHLFLFKNVDRELSDADSPAFSAGVTPEVYNTLVEALDLSARTLNCLKRAGINRVGEVLLMPKSELLKIKNFGQKSLSELYAKMGEKGCLPQEPEVSEGAIPSEQSVQVEQSGVPLAILKL